MGPLDQAIFYWINRWPDSFAPFMVFLSKGTDGWATRIVLGIILIWLIWHVESRRMGLVAGLGWIVANGATDLWKKIAFARPGNELSDVIVRIPMSNSNGTASAHSANMAFIALAFAYYGGRRWGWAWGTIAFLVGVSRVYVGAHYPSQVLLGWATGIGTAALVIGLVERLFPRLRESEVLGEIDVP